MVRAPAKVNLFLAVLGELPDGYHRVETVLQAVSLWDEVVLRRGRGVALTCDEPNVPGDESNLCCRAARLLAERAGRDVAASGVTMTLRKNIPVQAGLGGGSSDAAATLVGLNRLWGLRLRRHELVEIAGELGADVPFSVHGGAALGTGRGERLERLAPNPALHLVLANRPPGVSTAWAYSRWRPGRKASSLRRMLTALEAASLEGIAAALRNDLEDAVLPRRPDIAELKARLVDEGAVAALMCGSGSAVVGFVRTPKAAQDIAARLCKNGIWARAARSTRGGAAFGPKRR
jgi:4-diphosphocytidyl-2-C-methyl-D-erythritol kinase